jgi:hypothetical protein
MNTEKRAGGRGAAVDQSLPGAEQVEFT